MKIDTLDKNEILKVDIFCKKIAKYERVGTSDKIPKWWFYSEEILFYYTPRRFNASF